MTVARAFVGDVTSPFREGVICMAGAFATDITPPLGGSRKKPARRLRRAGFFRWGVGRAKKSSTTPLNHHPTEHKAQTPAAARSQSPPAHPPAPQTKPPHASTAFSAALVGSPPSGQGPNRPPQTAAALRETPPAEATPRARTSVQARRYPAVAGVRESLEWQSPTAATGQSKPAAQPPPSPHPPRRQPHQRPSPAPQGVATQTPPPAPCGVFPHPPPASTTQGPQSAPSPPRAPHPATQETEQSHTPQKQTHAHAASAAHRHATVGASATSRP